MFKTVLRGLWTFGFVGFKIVFWVLFVELGGHFFISPTKSRAQVSSVLPSPSTLGLSTSRYTAVLRITRNFLITPFLLNHLSKLQSLSVLTQFFISNNNNKKKKKKKKKTILFLLFTTHLVFPKHNTQSYTPDCK